MMTTMSRHMPLQYFMDMDGLYEHACEVEAALETAIATEQFGRAAAHMREYRELQAQDPVHGILKVGLSSSASFACQCIAVGPCGQFAQRRCPCALAPCQEGRRAPWRPLGEC